MKKIKILFVLFIILSVLFVVIMFKTILSDRQKPEYIVKKYLDCKTWQDRLNYVRDSERVKPLMEEYYKKRILSTEYLEIRQTKTIQLEKSDWIVIKATMKNDESVYYYFVTKTRDGYKIDWESSVGYNPITINAFKAQKPISSTRFRIWGQLGNYYSYKLKEYGYTNDSCLSVSLAGKDGESGIFGYIGKNSIDGQRLYEVLKDGEWHPLILELKYPGFIFTEAEVLIDRFVQEYWIEKDSIITSANNYENGNNTLDKMKSDKKKEIISLDLLSKEVKKNLMIEGIAIKTVFQNVKVVNRESLGYDIEIYYRPSNWPNFILSFEDMAISWGKDIGKYISKSRINFNRYYLINLDQNRKIWMNMKDCKVLYQIIENKGNNTQEMLDYGMKVISYQ